MTRSALLWSAFGIALAGFAAGTVLHPLSLPARPVPVAPAAAPESPVSAERLFQRCAKQESGDKSACYESDLLPLAATRGATAALAVLERLAALDPEVKRTAHAYAHAIGVSTYDAAPDVKRSFPTCREIFQSGCYHGVIQAYFMRAGTDDSGAVRGLCAPWTQDGVYGWLRFQCTHGLGHGLTMLVDHDLPGALERCDALNDDWDRESCYGGAFMENVMDATQPHEPLLAGHSHAMHKAAGTRFKEIDPADPAYPCSILAQRYLLSCWENQVSIILHLTGGNVARSSAGCERAPAAYVRWCFIGLGTDINGRSVSNVDTALVLCDSTARQWRAWCYVGVAKNLIEEGAQSKSGMAFCRLVRGRTEKMRCYEAVGEEIASVSERRSDREAMCADSEAEYEEACRFGARLMVDRPASLPPDS